MAQPHVENFIQHQKEEINNTRNRLGTSHPEVARSLSTLALYFYHVIRNLDEALNALTQALEIFKVQPEHTCDLELAVTIVDIGDIYRAMGNHEKAVFKYKEALKIFRENDISESHPAVCGATRGVMLLRRTNVLLDSRQ
eukprot:14280658-Ditylum_brightwellii.AAC.1